MSDATLIAAELADISAGFDRLAAALAQLRPSVSVTVPESAPAQVSVTVPAALPPTVNVAPAVVNVNLP